MRISIYVEVYTLHTHLRLNDGIMHGVHVVHLPTGSFGRPDPLWRNQTPRVLIGRTSQDRERIKSKCTTACPCYVLDHEKTTAASNKLLTAPLSPYVHMGRPVKESLEGASNTTLDGATDVRVFLVTLVPSGVCFRSDTLSTVNRGHQL